MTDSTVNQADDATLPGRRLLLVHAHPDDETIATGATMARYAAEGTHVTLVTCTLGEEGEILVAELRHLGADAEDRLAEHRITELRDAMAALGVTDYRQLGGAGRYRDSGMMGAPSNKRPGCFWQADLDEAAAHLVAVIREVRPQVLVTYDPNGGYGHPDHIQAHRVAMRAVELAADPPYGHGPAHRVAKVYWACIPRSVIQAGIDRMAAAGESFPFEGITSADDFPGAVDDALVACEVHGDAFVAAKLAAMRAYPTQISVDGPFFALSNNLGQEVFGTEYYQLAVGAPGVPAGQRETDLFAGLDV